MLKNVVWFGDGLDASCWSLDRLPCCGMALSCTFLPHTKSWPGGVFLAEGVGESSAEVDAPRSTGRDFLCRFRCPTDARSAGAQSLALFLKLEDRRRPDDEVRGGVSTRLFLVSRSWCHKVYRLSGEGNGDAGVALG